jgi:hypothetical protein
MTTKTGYSEMADHALAGLYSTGTDADRTAVLAEYRRQDANRARRARYAAQRAEWECWAYAQYLQAEYETRGNLVARGSHVRDGWALWSGPHAAAMKNASEELRNFWDANPRLTVSEYIAQISREHNLEAEAYRAEVAARTAAETEVTEKTADDSGHAAAVRCRAPRATFRLRTSCRARRNADRVKRCAASRRYARPETRWRSFAVP